MLTTRFSRLCSPISLRRVSARPAALWLLLAALPLSLTSCSGVDAIANHGSLDVHTHMSETVFLDPVAPRLKTVYIGMRNTSDYPELDVRGPLAAAIQARGYTIVSDPASAHYLLQGNVLQAGKISQANRQALLGGGFGQPLLAGAVAGGVTRGFGGSGNAALGVGLGVAAASLLVNAAYQDVTYAVTVDLQISERPLHGGKVRQSTRTYRGTGSSSVTTAITDSTPETFGTSTSGSQNSNQRFQAFDDQSDFIKYNVRDVAYADQVNLQMDQAVPTIVAHMASSFANLFE